MSTDKVVETPVQVQEDAPKTVQETTEQPASEEPKKPADAEVKEEKKEEKEEEKKEDEKAAAEAKEEEKEDEKGATEEVKEDEKTEEAKEKKTKGDKKKKKAKKEKKEVEQPKKDHRVVLVQRLAPEISVQDIAVHAAKEGTVVEQFVQEKTRHAFLEMSTHEEALAVVDRLSKICVKGNQLRVELSAKYATVTRETVNKVLVLSLPGLQENGTDCRQLVHLLESKGGKVRRIQLWTCKDDGVVQGLIEMDSNESAQVLREQVSGYNLGSGATVRLSYSNKSRIEVKQPQFGLDFTVGATPEGQGKCPRVGHPAHHGHGHGHGPHGHGHGHHAVHAHHGHHGPHGHHNGPQGHMHGGHREFRNHHHHEARHHMHERFPQHDRHMGHHVHEHHAQHMPHGPMGFGMPQHLATSVVLVKNLREGTLPVQLFRLFSTVGDVIAVKITFKQRSSALVQFSDVSGAEEALVRLNGCPFYEERRRLEVVPSKVQNISGHQDELTEYYHDSMYHRFAGEKGMRNLQNMNSPDAQLHISNIPVNVKESVLEDALRHYCDDVQTRWIQNKANNEARTKMCIATLDSTRSAVAALMGMHTVHLSNMQANGKGIIVSFSKRSQMRQMGDRRGSRYPQHGAAGLIPDPTRSRDAMHLTRPNHP